MSSSIFIYRECMETVKTIKILLSNFHLYEVTGTQFHPLFWYLPS